MSLEWVKLDISNLLHRLIVVTSSIHVIPEMWCVNGPMTFLNFGK